MGAYMWVYLAVLLSAQSLTEAAPCGAIADCDDTNGVCVDDICFCNAEFMGPDCKTPCGTCVGTQVCDTDTTCADCSPACDGTGGSCATVNDTPTCKCNTGWSGPTCAIAVATCGTGKCATTEGDCVEGVCYCKALSYGPHCADTCGACTGDQVCDTAATCADCSPACDGTGGSCTTVDETPTCKCNTGWSGPACAIAVSTCGSGKCATTEGECVSGVCYCKALAYGPHCADTCTACSAGQVCTGASACAACDPACSSEGGSCAAVDTIPTCKCNTHFSGDDCRTITCSGVTDPCLNGGTCASGVCTCLDTHAGHVCELVCTGCTANQKCVEEGGNPGCKTKCAAPADCNNGGTCTADDLCNCATGWEGDLCDQQELVCDPACAVEEKCVEEDGSNVCKATCATNDACKNNGTCENELCNCAEGWTGDLCTDSGVSSVVPSVLSMALFMLVIRL